jgi:hypothetical protein
MADIKNKLGKALKASPLGLVAARPELVSPAAWGARMAAPFAEKLKDRASAVAKQRASAPPQDFGGFGMPIPPTPERASIPERASNEEGGARGLIRKGWEAYKEAAPLSGIGMLPGPDFFLGPKPEPEPLQLKVERSVPSKTDPRFFTPEGKSRFANPPALGGGEAVEEGLDEFVGPPSHEFVGPPSPFRTTNSTPEENDAFVEEMHQQQVAGSGVITGKTAEDRKKGYTHASFYGDKDPWAAEGQISPPERSKKEVLREAKQIVKQHKAEKRKKKKKKKKR